jgi:ubiquitin carboxyl-terminal hydrolase L5
MDMLDADLALSNKFDEWKRAKDAKKKKGGARKNQAKTKNKIEEEPGFHFIAYVPINGHVWRLDGLQRQPVNLGMLGSLCRLGYLTDSPRRSR